MGCTYLAIIFELKLTFYRGKRRSQNDIVLSTKKRGVLDLHILPRTVYSDHYPKSLSCNVLIHPPFDILLTCSKDCFNDNIFFVFRVYLRSFYDGKGGDGVGDLKGELCIFNIDFNKN